MKKNFLQITLFLISVAFFAQEKNEEKKDDNKSKSISELTKSCKKINGLFTIYQDTINGKIKMAISESQLEEEFIHFSQIAEKIWSHMKNKKVKKEKRKILNIHVNQTN